MGCIFGTNSQTNDPPREEKYKSSIQGSGAAKSRVNETDKAILDVKARMRKLKTYVDKLNIQSEQ